MMRLVARNSSGAMLAKTDIVLPVSDELDCRTCHASGSPNSARPSAGWSFLSDAERDYKTNIERLHDDRHRGSPAYQNALLAKDSTPPVSKLLLEAGGRSCAPDAMDRTPCRARV